MKHIRIRAVLFDMDGLMFDTERYYLQAWEEVGATLFSPEAFQRVSLGTLGMTDRASVERVAEELGDAARAELIFSEVLKRRQAGIEENPVPKKPGLDALLLYLQKNDIKAAVVSSSEYQLVETLLMRAGVQGYFQAIAAGSMATNSKPAPDLYLLGAEMLQIPPSNCLALEDSINGIQSAHAAKAIPVMIPDRVHPDSATQSLCYAQLQDLFGVIQLIEKCR